ncbi:myosin light chain 2 [[Candida] railenensis]|uniref:Myosin light chain 2 n=1 Tax=[Candida] railenensis TaxID=45579 RepID=A0A9P0VZD7_9ASCO|nr:myosin light chain 2 [[Candida] railenensis]
MSALNTLSNNQKVQLRNAFTIIDGDSRDSTITKQDLKNLYTTLGLPTPTDKQLGTMLEGKDGVNFTQFSNIMAKEFSKFDDKLTIYNALKVFAEDTPTGNSTTEEEFIIDVDTLKEACCSVQLGEIGSGDHRLERKTFDKLVNGFIKEEIDGKKVFLASKWLDAYID